MKLVSLKLTAADKKAQKEKYSTAIPSSGEDYGYGMCISLDKAALEKLGLTPSSFDVGDEVAFEGTGTIKALRQDKSSSYNSSNVEIQITKLGVEGGSAEDAIDRILAEQADDE